MQQEFAFKERDELIGDMCLPKVLETADGTVSHQVVRFVLFRLNQYLGNKSETFVGKRKISEETGYGISTISRALEALESKGLITKVVKKSEQSSTVCTHFSVDWYQVGKLGKKVKHPELVEPERSPMEGDRSPMEPERSPIQNERSPMEGDQSPTYGVRPLDHGLDQDLDTIDHDGSDGASKNGLVDGLPETIEPKWLDSPKIVETLWQDVKRANALPDTDLWRRLFFAACHAVRRVKSIERPGAVLRYRLGQCRLKKFNSEELRIDAGRDEAWAKQAISEVDGIVLVGTKEHKPSVAIPEPPRIDQQRQVYALNLLTALEAKGYRESLTELDIEQIRGDPQRWFLSNRERFPLLVNGVGRRDRRRVSR